MTNMLIVFTVLNLFVRNTACNSLWPYAYTRTFYLTKNALFPFHIQLFITNMLIVFTVLNLFIRNTVCNSFWHMLTDGDLYLTKNVSQNVRQ